MDTVRHVGVWPERGAVGDAAWRDEMTGQMVTRDLQIPLACLKAAVEILKADTPGDRPLFRLPIEVRSLIRPLLQKSLADVRIPGATAGAMADSHV